MVNDFTLFYGSEDPYLLEELYLSLTEKKYTKKHLNVDYRWINYWDTNELFLSDSSDSGKWRKFSYVDYAWMEVLLELRNFGAAAKLIKPIRDSLRTLVSAKEIIEMAKNLGKEKDFKSKLKPNDEAAFQTAWDNPDSVPELDEIKLSLFGIFLIEAILRKAQNGLMIFQNGEFHPYSDLYFKKGFEGPTYEAARKEIIEKRSHSHLYISFTDILLKSILNDKINPESDRLALLTEDEYDVLNLIRDGSLKSLNIKLKEGEITLIEATETKVIDPEARFLEVIMKDGYQNILFSTQKGKIVSFENTRKIKPKGKKS